MKTPILILFLIARAAAQWTSPPTKTCEALMHISVNDFNCTSNEECDTLHCIFTSSPTNLTFTLMFLPCNHPPAGRLTFFLSGSVIFDRVFSEAQVIPVQILGAPLSVIVRVEYLPYDVIGIQATGYLQYTRIPLDTSSCSTGIPLVPGVMVLLLSLLGGRYCTH